MPADRVVAVHQPNYLPYLGFFHKMRQATVFVLYDTAQFTRNGFTNRNQIKTPNRAHWLTVPIRGIGHQAIMDVEIASKLWAKKHLRSLQANYQRAPYFSSYFSELSSTLLRPWTKLSELNIALIRCLSRCLSIETRLVLASTLPAPPADDPTEKLVHFTVACGGSVYLSGSSGRTYLVEGKLGDISVRYAEFVARPYPQLHGTFVPNLSAIDALFNCGDKASGLLESFGDTAVERVNPKHHEA